MVNSTNSGYSPLSWSSNSSAEPPPYQPIEPPMYNKNEWEETIFKAETEYYNPRYRYDVVVLLESYTPNNPNQEIVFKNGVVKSIIEIALNHNMLNVAKKLKAAGAIVKLEKSKDAFNSIQEYFSYLSSNIEELQKSLFIDESILDRVEETNQSTLLHIIAESYGKEVTFAVAPYLTDERVKRQNAKGNTVLHNHIKRISEKDVWFQTLSTYLQHANKGETLHIRNNEGDTALSRLYVYAPYAWDPYNNGINITKHILNWRDEYLPNLDLNIQCKSGRGCPFEMTLVHNRYDEALLLLKSGVNVFYECEDEKFLARNIVPFKKKLIEEEIKKQQTQLEELPKDDNLNLLEQFSSIGGIGKRGRLKESCEFLNTCLEKLQTIEKTLNRHEVRKI